jgi:hypothetical protein
MTPIMIVRGRSTLPVWPANSSPHPDSTSKDSFCSHFPPHVATLSNGRIHKKKMDRNRRCSVESKTCTLSFPYKVHQILEDAENCGFEEIVSWMPGPILHSCEKNRSSSNDGAHRLVTFRVHKPKEFALLIMRRYFPSTNKYRTFQRNLNIWCFDRVQQGPQKNAYHHPFFVRGHTSLCQQMVRVKNKSQAERGPGKIFYGKENIMLTKEPAPSWRKGQEKDENPDLLFSDDALPELVLLPPSSSFAFLSSNEEPPVAQELLENFERNVEGWLRQEIL